MAFKMKNILSLFLATLLIVFFLSFLFVFIFATPNNRAMKCNDPDINQPVTRRENWFGLIMAMFMPAFLNCFLIIPNLKQVTSKQRSDSIVFLVHPMLIYLTGLFATCVLVLSVSYYYGTLAPNFVAACQPEKLQELCGSNSNTYVFVNCTTPYIHWLPARSAFPSIIPTVYAFGIYFFALQVSDFVEVSGKVKWILLTLLQIVALAMIGLIGYVPSNLIHNEAHHSGVWVGCIIGILAAIGTVVLIEIVARANSQELPSPNENADDPAPKTKKGIWCVYAHSSSARR